MKDKVGKLAKVGALVEFRKKHMMKELEANLKVWREIRDNPKATDKNRIEAGKAIARQLGSLQPDKETSKPKEASKKEVISEKEQAEIDKRLDKILNRE